VRRSVRLTGAMVPAVGSATDVIPRCRRTDETHTSKASVSYARAPLPSVRPTSRLASTLRLTPDRFLSSLETWSEPQPLRRSTQWHFAEVRGGYRPGWRDLEGVLSIGRLSGKTRTGRYYVDRVAKGREDYYVGAGEADGEWVGLGAGLLGLKGRVDGDELRTLLEGRAPRSDTKLRNAPGPDAVTGFDLTFSAPKSVSVLYAVGDDDVSRAVREGHDAAVRAALRHLEREACRARRGRGGLTRVPGDGFIAGVFRHRTSRAGDPQLHTHAVIANSTRASGTWSTLDSRSLYREGRTAGFLYQAALRAELTERLGVDWGPVHRGSAEIVGVPKPVIRHFSRRRREVVARLAERGESSAAAARTAALDTRRSKDYGVPVDRLRADWQARAAEHGLDRKGVRRLLGVARPEVAERELEAAAGEVAGPHGICREQSAFDRRAALRWWAEAHRHGAQPEAIRSLVGEWLASRHAVPLGDLDRQQAGEPDSERWYSTPEMLSVERRLVESAAARRGEGVAVVAREHVDRALAERGTIAREQAAMVRSLVGSGDGVEVVRAAAGTGKTFALDAARSAWEAEGVRVYGCALSARAAAELHDQTGIDATTIAQLRIDLDRGHALPVGGVLVVDEAGMVGSRQLAELAEQAAAHRTKLVLVGDDRQLPELEAGGAFAGLADRLDALELHEVRRQQSGWDREALSALREGDVASWAGAYRDRGRIVGRPNARHVREELVRDWWHAARTGGLDGALMLAHRRADVRDLNDRARALMHADGRLGDEELEAADRAFAAGDRVITTHNDRRLRVTNGWRGTVREIHPQEHAVTVDLDNGRSVVLDAGYLDDGHLDHGYAATAHKAQGATVDSVFVLGSEDLYREWGYTALTRHRDEARFYVVSPAPAEHPIPGLEPEPDPLEERLTRTLGASRAKSFAMDLADAPTLDREVDLREAIERHELLRNEVEETRHAAARAREELAEVEARLRDLQEDRGTLRWWQSERRAELDQHIQGHERAAEYWRERSDELAAAGELADERFAEFIDAHGDRLADGGELAPNPFVDAAQMAPIAEPEPELAPDVPIEPPDVGIDLGP
jgi:Ti-type conjugative transfer relaxase TraA